MKIVEADLKEVIGQFKSMLQSSILIPIIGSGFSCGCEARNGIVPNGNDMKKAMIQSLVKVDYCDKDERLEDKSFKQIARYYNNFVSKKDRSKYLLDCFTKVKLPQELIAFLNLPWNYVYTLNIDDAIERNSDFAVVEPNRKLENNVKDYGRLVFKMHGDAKNMIILKEEDEFSVFDTDQYIESLEKNKWILNQLKQDYIDKNLLFIGCSLQEELDFLHVVFKAKEQRFKKTERFYISDSKLSRFQLLDLEKNGITKVVYVDSYQDFYYKMVDLKNSIQELTQDNLTIFKNISIEQLKSYDEQNKSYILNGKHPYIKAQSKICLPYFFIDRDISNNILVDMNNYPIQIIYGKRVSGKSYLLLGMLQRISNMDKYYFDSRERISRKNLDYLLGKENLAIIIDTNVLREDEFDYLISYDVENLKKRNIHIILASNVSKMNDAIVLNKAQKKEMIKLYYLKNRFNRGKEYEMLRAQLTSCNLLYFNTNQTILDNIVSMQEKIGKGSQFFLKSFRIDYDNVLHLVYLLLLAHYGKVTSLDIVQYCLLGEPYKLMPKLDSAVEEDYSSMITASIFDSSYYQIVCNAQGWLLGYLSKISINPQYRTLIIKSFYYIVDKLNENKDENSKNSKKLFNFIRFDNINMLLGGVHKKGTSEILRQLIQAIYAEIRPILGQEYQFNHQHAKCLLWAVEEAPQKERDSDLDQALRSINICIDQIQEAVKTNPGNERLITSLAHAQFTLGIIRIKIFYFNINQENFRKAVTQLSRVLNYSDNLDAKEFLDESSDDDQDYSISRFMDSLISNEWPEYIDGLKNEIRKIINYRLQKLIR